MEYSVILLFFIYIQKNSSFTANIDYNLINFNVNLGINVDKCMKMEYIYNSFNSEGGKISLKWIRYKKHMIKLW